MQGLIFRFVSKCVEDWGCAAVNTADSINDTVLPKTADHPPCYLITGSHKTSTVCGFKDLPVYLASTKKHHYVNQLMQL